KTLVDSGRNGNLTTRIESDTYLGVWKDIIHSLNELMAAFAAPITEALISLDEISYGNFDNRIDNEYNGDFNKIALSLNSTSETISSYINEIGTVIYKISQGDLTVSINREYVGAFSKIKDSINAIIHILKTTIIDVNAASRQIVIGAEQVSNSAMNVAQGASEQAMNIAELSNFFTEINVRMKKSTAEAKKAGSLSARSVKKAADCSAEMNLLLSAMEGIKTSSKKISTIISAIEEIALQTNLLALNASVEAAHVGAAGKGFGVVADSVRGLAGRSKRAVRQTEDFINESILHVNDGSERATDASDTFGRIVADIDRSADLVGRVSDFCEKQSEDIHEISKRVGQMSKVVHSNSAMCEEFAAASEELNSQAQVLKEAVSFFNL
ncbi:MAG: methyl-accepting chemotaxis protein, partial [Clostridiales bacterium]|nr:methyl-accepting chemotaxis protein [Clostridiales bacterium]